MADRKEWKNQLLSRLLDQYEKSATYAGENKVKQVFSVKPSDIFKGYNEDLKQALLQRIARENPGLSWYHFGDLDPDGLAIAEHLIRKTGLPFQLCAMGVQELQRFQTYAKPLAAPDRAKAETNHDPNPKVPIVAFYSC